MKRKTLLAFSLPTQTATSLSLHPSLVLALLPVKTKLGRVLVDIVPDTTDLVLSYDWTITISCCRPCTVYLPAL